MPIGTIIHNVEMKPEKGGQIARSAAMESATDTAIEGDQGEDRLAPQAAVEEV